MCIQLVSPGAVTYDGVTLSKSDDLFLIIVLRSDDRFTVLLSKT